MTAFCQTAEMLDGETESGMNISVKPSFIMVFIHGAVAGETHQAISGPASQSSVQQVGSLSVPGRGLIPGMGWTAASHPWTPAQPHPCQPITYSQKMITSCWTIDAMDSLAAWPVAAETETTGMYQAEAVPAQPEPAHLLCPCCTGLYPSLIKVHPAYRGGVLNCPLRSKHDLMAA